MDFFLKGIIVLLTVLAVIIICLIILNFEHTRLYEHIQTLDCKDQKKIINEHPYDLLVNYYIMNCIKI